MSYEYIKKALTKGTVGPESGEEYYRMMLKNFENLDEHFKLLIVQQIHRYAEKNNLYSQLPQVVATADITNEPNQRHDSGVVYPTSDNGDEIAKKNLKELIPKTIVFVICTTLLFYFIMSFISGEAIGANDEFSDFLKLIKVLLGI